jgi:hypothetical protein
MFTFFGLFADPTRDLPEQFSRTWPGVDVVTLDQPISAVGVRFGQDRYEPALEDIPEPVIRTVERLSLDYPAIRFLLLRAECSGGICGNWGQIIQNGKVTSQAQGEGALGILIRYWGVDLGPTETFDPLRRDFPWN